MAKRSYAPILWALGGLTLVGGGLAIGLALAIRRRELGGTPTNYIFFQASPSSAPASTAAAAAAGSTKDDPSSLKLSGSAVAKSVFAWSKASIVLADLPDPYNKGIEELAIEKNRQAKFSDTGPAAALYQGIYSIIGAVPVVGQVVIFLYKFFEFAGNLIVGDSHGGWSEITPLMRLRGEVTMVIPTHDFFAAPRPYKSQRIDMKAPSTRPERYPPVAFAPKSKTYEADYSAWLRRYLQEGAYRAEWFRINSVWDEAMLPKPVIGALFEAGAWPPPLEPMPLTLAEWQARYRDVASPIKNFYWDTSPIVDVVHTSPQEQAEDRKLAELVYGQLYAEYLIDAEHFANAIAGIRWPPDILQLGLDLGVMPRLGSPANPIIAAAAPGESY